MTGNPEPLPLTPILTFRQLLLAELYACTNCVKTFDPVKLSLVTYYWPVQGQVRVPPGALREYRGGYNFLGPCCLCPLLEPLSKEPKFTEAAIYMPVFGRYAGEYIAGCAQSRCGYVVPLERIYTKIGVPVKIYPLRDTNTVCPPTVLHNSEKESRVSRPLKRTYAQADLNNPTECPPRQGKALYRTDW